jgi:hypothetical protein
MNQKEIINILVIGEACTGKSTLINSYLANDLINIKRNSSCSTTLTKVESEFMINHNDDIFINFVDTEGYKNSKHCLQNLNSLSAYVDAFFVVYDMKSIQENKQNLDLICEIKKIIETRKYGYIFIIVNKCDEYHTNYYENGSSFIQEMEQYNNTLSGKEINMDDENLINFVNKVEKYNNFCKSVKDCIDDEFNNIIPLNAYDAYLYRCLYHCDNIDDPETEKEINNIIKLQIGECIYKKMKIPSLTLKDKRNFLKNKYCFDEMYENAMDESGYTDFANKIKKFISLNSPKIFTKHIKDELDKLKTADDITYIILEFKKIIARIICVDDKDIYDNISFFIHNKFDECVLSLSKNPTKISTLIINDISEIDSLIFSKLGCYMLKNLINFLKTVRNENLVDIFKFLFDKNILDEIKDKLTVEILHESLNNSVKNMTMTEYFSAIRSIANITSYDANYIAVTALFVTRFIDINHHIVNKNIAIKNTVEKILNEETDKSVKFVLLHLLHSVDSKKINMNNRVLLCNYDEFDKINETIMVYYHLIKEIFNGQKYKNMKTVSDAKNYILSLDEKYKNISSLSFFIKIISSECDSVTQALQLIEKCHNNGALYTMIDTISAPDKKEVSENNIKNTKKKVAFTKKKDSDDDE